MVIWGGWKLGKKLTNLTGVLTVPSLERGTSNCREINWLPSMHFSHTRGHDVGSLDGGDQRYRHHSYALLVWSTHVSSVICPAITQKSGQLWSVMAESHSGCLQYPPAKYQQCLRNRYPIQPWFDERSWSRSANLASAQAVPSAQTLAEHVWSLMLGIFRSLWTTARSLGCSGIPFKFYLFLFIYC